MADKIVVGEEERREQKAIKKKKFYVLFTIMCLSLMLIISQYITQQIARTVGQFILLILQYIFMDGVLTDYFAG